jgi:glycogen debranching enzyme
MPKDEDWVDLQMTFSHTFKNQPYEYHNGGLWPMITGFYVADLARRGRKEEARRYLEGIHQANSRATNGTPWSFPEYLHGQKFIPGGNTQMGWSAAAAVLGQHALDGTPFLRTARPET